MKFLSVEEVIEIHDDLVIQYGGLMGIRDMGLLISAIETPKATMFGEYLHDSIFDKASAYMYHIVSNHAFVDGNKRTGAASSLIFLKVNGIKHKYDIKTMEDLVVRVAMSQVNKTDISHYLERKIEKYVGE